MSYCSKCGNEITNEMEFCPKCGASLRFESSSREAYEKHEKGEKEEKEEKQEKQEKHEKGETSRFWALIGGLIVILIGVTSLISTIFDLSSPWRGALFMIVIGALIIIVAIYGAIRSSRRSPRP